MSAAPGCPRGREAFADWQRASAAEATFGVHGCSYCGSISPNDFFAAIEAGAEIGPTDKSYKVYVRGTRKFYFQHLDDAGRDRFIELHNAGKIKIGFPGHFYVPPFFCAPIKSGEAKK